MIAFSAGEMSQVGCSCAVVLLAFAAALSAGSQDVLPVVPGRTVTQVQDQADGLIRLDVVVTDKSGAPVTGLDAREFSLLENGSPQRIVSFRGFDGTATKIDPPVRIILVIDTIELSPTLAREERVAVESFLRENGGRLAQPVSVYFLADTGLWTVARGSDDGNTLANEIAHNNLTLLRRIGVGEGEALRGNGPEPASESALKALAQIACAEKQVAGRKLLLWIGPGWNMGSGTLAERVPFSKKPFYAICWFSTLLREARVALYSFAVGETDPNSQIYKSYLKGVESEQKAGFINLYRKVLAVQSGGRVVDESQALVKEIESCAREANSFYTISFDPARADHADEYHELKVQIDRPGLTARTSTGYYDQPWYQVERIPPARRVSVAQLEQLVVEDPSEGDAEMARRISDLELTERLTSARFAEIASKVHGKKTQVALVVLADASAFLDPPADEIPTDPAPDASAQQQMLAKTANYLSETIPRLPDLFATRVTVRYQEKPEVDEGGVVGDAYEPLHMTDTSKASVHYRGGFEVADLEKKSRKTKWDEAQLITYGTFGPVLLGVSRSIAQNGGLTWSHWERGTAGGKVAVFRYTIPLEQSLYEVEFCCSPDRNWSTVFQRNVGYHGVIAIDPASGAILRLEWDAELPTMTPMAQSQIMIEYGAVDIAGKRYVCPLRSISIVRGRSVTNLELWNQSYGTYGAFVTMLNDITFSDYHVFRSESRVLPGFDESHQK